MRAGRPARTHARTHAPPCMHPMASARPKCREAYMSAECHHRDRTPRSSTTARRPRTRAGKRPWAGRNRGRGSAPRPAFCVGCAPRRACERRAAAAGWLAAAEFAAMDFRLWTLPTLVSYLLTYLLSYYLLTYCRKVECRPLEALPPATDRARCATRRRRACRLHTRRSRP